jgi:hypothetical protein
LPSDDSRNHNSFDDGVSGTSIGGNGVSPHIKTVIAPQQHAVIVSSAQESSSSTYNEVVPNKPVVPAKPAKTSAASTVPPVEPATVNERNATAASIARIPDTKQATTAPELIADKTGAFASKGNDTSPEKTKRRSKKPSLSTSKSSDTASLSIDSEGTFFDEIRREITASNAASQVITIETETAPTPSAPAIASSTLGAAAPPNKDINAMTSMQPKGSSVAQLSVAPEIMKQSAKSAIVPLEVVQGVGNEASTTKSIIISAPVRTSIGPSEVSPTIAHVATAALTSELTNVAASYVEMTPTAITQSITIINNPKPQDAEPTSTSPSKPTEPLLNTNTIHANNDASETAKVIVPPSIFQEDDEIFADAGNNSKMSMSDKKKARAQRREQKEKERAELELQERVEIEANLRESKMLIERQMAERRQQQEKQRQEDEDKIKARVTTDVLPSTLEVLPPADAEANHDDVQTMALIPQRKRAHSFTLHEEAEEQETYDTFDADANVDIETLPAPGALRRSNSLLPSKNAVLKENGSRIIYHYKCLCLCQKPKKLAGLKRDLRHTSSQLSLDEGLAGTIANTTISAATLTNSYCCYRLLTHP